MLGAVEKKPDFEKLLGNVYDFADSCQVSKNSIANTVKLCFLTVVHFAD